MNKVVFPETLRKRLGESKILAVLVIENVEDAVPVARALKAGGITAMELALRTPAALDALKAIKKEFPDFIAGAGTVLTAEQVDQVADYVDLIVTPGCSPAVIERAAEKGIPIAPGVATPSEIETAIGYGCRTVKLFPAAPLGGIPYLNAINAPYAHLGISYIPLGGVHQEDCAEWAHHKNVLCFGGSWIANKKLIEAKDWDQITKNAKEAIELCK